MLPRYKLIFYVLSNCHVFLYKREWSNKQVVSSADPASHVRGRGLGTRLKYNSKCWCGRGQSVGGQDMGDNWPAKFAAYANKVAVTGLGNSELP